MDAKGGNGTASSRRRIVIASTAFLLAQGRTRASARTRADPRMSILSPALQPGVTLLSAPIELAGDWGGMIPNSAVQVLELMRRACLEDVRLVSDRQPTRIRVDEHTSGPPAVWLHADGSTTAWIVVDIGERAWAQLAYQFGHELGHVAANSWLPHAVPKGPCQWLEEALVEAFSLRGLGRLGATWRRTPPFPGDNAYGEAITAYRSKILEDYRRLAADQGGLGDARAWFARHRARIEAGDGLNAYARAASLLILAEYERAPACLAAIGALNRWPGRTALPLGDYLDQWKASCIELSASTQLPAFLMSQFKPG